MSKYEIPFISLCIREFGNRFHVGRAAAYEYLRTYQGLQFLIQFYDVEHLQSIEDTVDDLVLWCNKNGGGLS